MDHPIYTFRKERGLTIEAFASLVGVKKSAVSKWQRGKGPAPETALKIEAATDGALSRCQLRPDLYPPSHQPISTSDRVAA